MKLRIGIEHFGCSESEDLSASAESTELLPFLPRMARLGYLDGKRELESEMSRALRSLP